MRNQLVILALSLLSVSAYAGVHVFVEDINGKAAIKYQCTGGEIIRAFALDVTVNQGVILGVSDFFRGESTAGARGYGIFPASFRDRITISSGTNVNWDVTTYTPLAVAGDHPADTRPGLNSPGVTLEFGALWDSTVQAAIPDAAGTLCALKISHPALVSIAVNQARGGVISASAGHAVTPVLSSATVDPTAVVTAISLTNGTVTIRFRGGELQAANGLGAMWTGTGNRTGTYSEPVGPANPRFFRVRRD